MELRGRMMALLSDEAGLEEIVKLVGMDALSAPDRLKMEAARSIREDFLHQLAFHDVDTYTSLHKQLLMMKLIIAYYDKSLDKLSDSGDIEQLAALPVRERIGRFKYIKEEDTESEFNKICAVLDEQVAEANIKEEF